MVDVHRSYFLRFLTSIYPFSEKDRPFVSDADMHAVNSSLLHAFVDAVHKDGATPLLIYLPNKRDFKKKPGWIPEGLQILQNAQLEHVDLTSCLKRDSEPNHFIPMGGTRRALYSPSKCGRCRMFGSDCAGLVRAGNGRVILADCGKTMAP